MQSNIKFLKFFKESSLYNNFIQFINFILSGNPSLFLQLRPQYENPIQLEIQIHVSMHVQKIFGASDFKHLLMQCTGRVHGYHNIIPQKPMKLTFVTWSGT